jgi:hypothetical protein
MTASTTPLAAPTPAPEPTHACIRCGRPGLPPEKALCEDCNPLELSQPSATQVHGIAALGIVAFVVLLAVAGKWVLAGTGPFVGSIAGVTATGSGLEVTVAVTNQGRTAGATTCRVEAAGNPLGGEFELVQSPLVQPGATIQFGAEVTKLGTLPIALQADCQSP